MATAVISRWARRFVLVAIAALVLSQGAALAGLPRRTEIVLGVYGFVLTVVFGKAYSLVPSYFDRTLAVPRAPALHLPLQVVAVGSLAISPIPGAPAWLATLGAVCWTGGVVVFAGSIARTVASNPLGRETGTSEANRDRARLDRVANPFMPIAVLYLLGGTYALLAGSTAFPTLLDGSIVRVSHLLAAGFALLLLFAVGYRLLPRFLVARSPLALAVIVLPAGAIGPGLLAVGYPSGLLFRLGGILEAVAVSGFAVSYLWLFVSTDRDRVGFFGPLFGLVVGLGGVALGLWFAFVAFPVDLVDAHWRLNVFGLLGLSILGVLYQFYPPTIAGWPATGNRLALVSLIGLAIGVVALGLRPIIGSAIGPVGHGIVALAGCAAGYLVVGVIVSGGRGS